MWVGREDDGVVTKNEWYSFYDTRNLTIAGRCDRSSVIKCLVVSVDPNAHVPYLTATIYMFSFDFYSLADFLPPGSTPCFLYNSSTSVTSSGDPKNIGTR